MDRILNMIIIIENGFGLYRNYLVMRKSRLIICMVQIFLELICIIIFVYPMYIAHVNMGVTGDSVYLNLALFSYLLTFLLCLYNSKLFKNLLYYLNENDILLKRDKIYQKKIRKCYRVIVTTVLIYPCLTLCYYCWELL